MALEVPTGGSKKSVSCEALADGFRVEAKLDECFVVQDLAPIKHKGRLFHHLQHFTVVIILKVDLLLTHHLPLLTVTITMKAGLLTNRLRANE